MSIKRIIVIVMAAVLCLSMAALAEEGSTAASVQDFLGRWVDQEGTCTVEVSPHADEEEVDGYIVNVQMNEADGAGYTIWAYGCVYDEETRTLQSISRVIGTSSAQSDEEEIGDINFDYTEAEFFLDNESRLIWSDRPETVDDDLSFTLIADWNEEEPYGQIVTPNNPEIDIEALQDGIYPVAFDRANLADGALTFTVYWEDGFDVVEIGLLAPGDYIFVDEQLIAVETVERGDDLLINGGLENGGVTLRSYDEDNCWKAVLENDLHTYFRWGETTLPLAADVTFTDGWDIDKEPVTVSGAEAVSAAIAASELDSFIQWNTSLRVENGRIVEIVREYMP